MASLSRIKNTSARVLWVVGTDGCRRSARLGKMNDREAGRLLDKVEALESCLRLNAPPDPQLAAWVAGLPDVTHARLAGLGLVTPRASGLGTVTVGEFCERYLGERGHDLKPASLRLVRGSVGKLAVGLGEQTPIGRITPDDAFQWRADLLAGGLAEGTVRLHTRNAKQIFRAASDRGLIESSPFEKLPSTAIAADRDRHVSADDALRVIDELPNAVWRVTLALGRFGGLRIPSETHALTWADIDWGRRRMRVYAPKAHRLGSTKADATRWVPIVPELKVFLSEAFDAAEPGEDRVVPLSRNNLHRTVRQAIDRAGVEAWADLFQALRRSCETDFASRFPQHAVSEWIGHSQAVSHKHYLQVTDDLFESASAGEPCNALQNALQHGPESLRTERNAISDDEAVELATAAVCGALHAVANGPAGIRTRDRAIMSRLL